MRERALAVAGILALVLLVNHLPFERQSNGITSLLSSWGDAQEQTSDLFTTEIVSDVEGELVGEHKIDGSNWSIPNILRHWVMGIEG